MVWTEKDDAALQRYFQQCLNGAPKQEPDTVPANIYSALATAYERVSDECAGLHVQVRRQKGERAFLVAMAMAAVALVVVLEIVR